MDDLEEFSFVISPKPSSSLLSRVLSPSLDIIPDSEPGITPTSCEVKTNENEEDLASVPSAVHICTPEQEEHEPM